MGVSEISSTYYVHGRCVHLLLLLWGGTVIAAVIVRIFAVIDWLQFGPDQSLGQVWIGPVCHSGRVHLRNHLSSGAVVDTGPVFQHYPECLLGIGTLSGYESGPFWLPVVFYHCVCFSASRPLALMKIFSCLAIWDCHSLSWSGFSCVCGSCWQIV